MPNTIDTDLIHFEEDRKVSLAILAARIVAVIANDIDDNEGRVPMMASEIINVPKWQAMVRALLELELERETAGHPLIATEKELEKNDIASIKARIELAPTDPEEKRAALEKLKTQLAKLKKDRDA